jgi:alpha-beta hydrolase superfamily lysophospholipase
LRAWRDYRAERVQADNFRSPPRVKATMPVMPSKGRVVAAIFGCALAVSIACSAPVETAQPSMLGQSVELTVQSKEAQLAATLRFPSTGSPAIARSATAGPFPAIVLAHGSGRVTRDQNSPLAERFLSMGLAVLTYDKRGVGQSTGTYVNVGTARSQEIFPLLADDALACLAALKARKDIDPRRIGLGGVSQAGWLVPLAASRSRDVAFLVILSGPAVTVGEEMEYSRLAGADPGSIQGLSDDEIARRMALFEGPHGYDPVPVLEQLATPSIWIEGEADRSLPMPKTLATLDRISRSGRPITVVRLPGANHSLFNPVTGQRPAFWPQVQAWLAGLSMIARVHVSRWSVRFE